MFQIIPRCARGYIVFHGKVVWMLRYISLVDGIWNSRSSRGPACALLILKWHFSLAWCSMGEGTCGGVMHSRCASFIFLHGKVSPLWVEAVAAVLVPFFNAAFSWALIVLRGKGWATLINEEQLILCYRDWTRGLQSSLFYCVFGIQLLFSWKGSPETCLWLHVWDFWLEDCLFCAVSFQHFLHFLTRTLYPWWISSYFIPAVPILVSILLIFTIYIKYISMYLLLFSQLFIFFVWYWVLRSPFLLLFTM